MTLMEIAYKNIIRDWHTYFSYYISSTATILLFYLFNAAAGHPDLNVIEDGSTLSLALATGTAIIYCFAFVFVGYSSMAFLGARSKQLGIYSILGMSPKQMKRMLFAENLIIGVAAILSGVVMGMVFSGLFFKLVRNIFSEGNFGLYLPIKPTIVTMALFMVLFLVIGLIIPAVISRKTVRVLLHYNQIQQKKIKCSVPKLLVVLLCIVFLGMLLQPKMEPVWGDLLTPLVLISGATAVYLLAPQIAAIVIAIKKHSKNALRGIHLFANAEIEQLVSENKTMMSLNAVLLSVAFLAMCALGAMQSNVTMTIESISPFAYMYVERPGNTHGQQDIHVLDQALASVPNIEKVSYTILRKEFTFGFLKESEYNRILSAKQQKPVHLEEGEVLIVPGSMSDKDSLYKINDEAKALLLQSMDQITECGIAKQGVSISGAYTAVYIVNDEVWNALWQQDNKMLYPEKMVGYEDCAWLSHLDVADDLDDTFAQDDKDYDYTYAFVTLGRYYQTELLMKKLCTFVGFSISLIFLIASVSIIYFRLFTSLEREKRKYRAMIKLGFSQKELNATINQKLGTLLWIPFLEALATMWVGMFYIESQTVSGSLSMSLLFSVVFFVIYFIFERLVVYIYCKQFI